MSIRWMAVQYIGDTLRIPVANESDMDMPFGSSTLERDVRRIVVNPFSDSPQAFVPEAENVKLRELARLVSEYISHDRCEGCVVKTACNSHELDECWMTTKLRNQLRELGVEVGQ